MTKDKVKVIRASKFKQMKHIAIDLIRPLEKYDFQVCLTKTEFCSAILLELYNEFNGAE